jgi:hypothetical protein
MLIANYSIRRCLWFPQTFQKSLVPSPSEMNAMQCIWYTSPLCRCCNYVCCSSNNSACKSIVVGIIYTLWKINIDPAR